jgi:uncharacterized protein (TIGR01777 family)
MRIALTGSHGLVGAALVRTLEAAGDEVIRLVRARENTGRGAIWWDPTTGGIDQAGLEKLDAVIHLAGENLASGRWTPARKRRIRESRVHGTRLIAETLRGLKEPPRVLLSASAVGFYGNRGDDVLSETSAGGEGFLAEVCREWEAATQPAADAGLRVACLRLGIVLSPEGGALARMLLPFKLGLGGPLGTGRQFWSWIQIEDVVEAVRYILKTNALAGPINLTAPEPVTNREFTRMLGQVLRRPAILPAPGWALRLALGSMADEALLASTRAVPAKLQAAGFEFRYPQLRGALEQAVT